MRAGGRSSLGGVFELDWLCRNELTFGKCSDIRNSFNSHKPVKIGRDGQEIEQNAGKSLCLLFEHDDDVDLEQIIKDASKLQKENPSKYVPQQPSYDQRDHQRRFNQRGQRGGYMMDNQQQRGRGPMRSSYGGGGPQPN